MKITKDQRMRAENPVRGDQYKRVSLFGEISAVVMRVSDEILDYEVQEYERGNLKRQYTECVTRSEWSRMIETSIRKGDDFKPHVV